MVWMFLPKPAVFTILKGEGVLWLVCSTVTRSLLGTPTIPSQNSWFEFQLLIQLPAKAQPVRQQRLAQVLRVLWETWTEF